MGASGLEKNATAARLDEERQNFIASHVVAHEEVDWQMTALLQPDRGPLWTVFEPDTEPADSTNFQDSSPHIASSRRATMTIDDVTPDTLVDGMQVLLTANS